MYTVPTPPLSLAIHGLRERHPVRLDPATLDAALRGAMRRFEAGHHAVGALRPPDELARRILDADPTLTQVSIVVQRMSLDRTTALLTAERVQYGYDPRGSRAVRRLPWREPPPARRRARGPLG
ncbi:MAG: hypothetical protein FJ148_02375 [Deltaproteobacteria bacterium]|nr:hypothetical protein [Deltaproteobacteria bacterium]